MKGTPREPFSGPRPYSKTGRGYPDVALLANNYIIGVDGTTASTPVFVGMISTGGTKNSCSKLKLRADNADSQY